MKVWNSKDKTSEQHKTKYRSEIERGFAACFF